MTKKYKTGLVLSGGGTRGFAHLGMIAALYEKGMRPEVISGVSAGAIVGAFIAAGMLPEEILEIFTKGWIFQYTKIHLPVDGLLKLDGVKEIIEKEIKVKKIEDLETPFYVCVSNLNKGTVEYRNSGPLGDTVLASSSIPVLFAPVVLGRDSYVDGGLMDNIPIEPIKNDCEQLIVSNISPINPKAKMKNLIQIATRTVYMSVNVKAEEAKKHATYYIEPKGIDAYEMFLRKHAEELFEIGYKTTKEIIDNKTAISK
ncbi:patatin-like phospholipase family protein [Prolixibacteraceae bacterium Z1-6]|uniref:Patatin-like phospholipase family protein n=1 Tax=Draconibacterium aestuarii TaxID=2998507 RepID=A0A9X3F765_9BACT|nr:patatin-like phospholipase family protein [Prolixibacteraceae bacterium Z1-6]